MCVCGRTFGRSVQKQHEGRGGTDARAGDRRWADRTSYGTVVSVDTMFETAGPSVATCCQHVGGSSDEHMEQNEIVVLGGQGNCRLLWSTLPHKHTVAHVKEARDTPSISAAKDAIPASVFVTNDPRIGIASHERRDTDSPLARRPGIRPVWPGKRGPWRVPAKQPKRRGRPGTARLNRGS